MAAKGKLGSEAYKGVRDFYPEDEAIQKYLFATMRDAVERFGYAEYHASVLEPAELYRSKGAENAEMVNEQTYTFLDRGQREVTLRPEMTPTVARMVAARRRELPFPLRWYSIPNVFRYERPQRGRLREHWQLNVDLFGSDTSAADAEIISVAHAVMLAFGAKESDFEIHIGSRTFLNALAERLSLSDEQARTLRGLLDRRAKISIEEFAAGLQALGVSEEDLSAQNTPAEIGKILTQLSELGINNARFDPSIVRGFDYYTGMVFEVFDTHPENNRSLFGGGRYDDLLELFGEDRMPAVGFGMGDVTMRDFLAVRDRLPAYRPPAKVYLAIASSDETAAAMQLADELRACGVNTAVDFGDKKLGDQIKTAAKQNIPYLVVVGPDEIDSGIFAVRTLADGNETTSKRDELANYLLSL